MRPLNYLAEIKNGCIKLIQPSQFGDELKRFDDKLVILSIFEKGQTRTKSQNSYLWGVIYSIISKETGHTVEDLHEIFKHMYLPKEIQILNKTTGEWTQTTISRSTTELTTKEFTEYVEKICLFAAEMGINIPFAGYEDL